MVTASTPLGGHSLPRVAVLGPFGTYSHEAADRYFGPNTRYEEKMEIKDVFHALSSSSAEFGVVPQENTIFGSVVETYDSLRNIDQSFVVGEIVLRIDHCLVARAGVQLEEIHTVLSHEQALGQCRNFLETHLPKAVTERTTSTAGAARALLDRPPGHAAICSRVCTTLFQGLQVLKEAIQAESNNYTRFYVLARSQGIDHPVNRSDLPKLRKGLFRTFIRNGTSTSHGKSPGIHGLISALETEVTRIDRRPYAGLPFNFVYFIEVQTREQESGASWKREFERKAKEFEELGLEVDLIGAW